MFLNYEPGDYVINPKNKDWGLGQIQSIIDYKVTVNFENAGKKVINAKEIIKKIKKIQCNNTQIKKSPYFFIRISLKKLWWQK